MENDARARRKSKGYSLAEVLLALGLCVTALLSAIALSIAALQSNQKNSDLMTADALANQAAELYIYALPTDATNVFWTGTSYGPDTLPPVSLGTSQFSEVVYTTDLSASSPGLKEIQVVVSWASGEQGRTGYGIQSTRATRVVSTP